MGSRYEPPTAEEWQAFTAEVIEIRKMTYSYRRTMLANDKASEKKPNEKQDGAKSSNQRSRVPET